MSGHVPTRAEQWLIEQLSPPEAGKRRPTVPGALLAVRAGEAGLTDAEFAAARFRLRVLWSTTGLSLDPLLCVACLQATPYVDRLHRLGLHPDCTSPITTWSWSALVDGRRPGARRRRCSWKVAHRPTGWLRTEMVRHWETGELVGGSWAACKSVFERADAGREMCGDTVVWQVVATIGKRSTIEHWCDADLPSELRPAAGLQPLPANDW